MRPACGEPVALLNGLNFILQERRITQRHVCPVYHQPCIIIACRLSDPISQSAAVKLGAYVTSMLLLQFPYPYYEVLLVPSSKD